MIARYHALYELNGGHFWRQFDADDLLHAIEQAIYATKEGEELISVLRVS